MVRQSTSGVSEHCIFCSRMKQGALPRVAWFLKWLFGKVSKWVAPKVSEVVERMFLTLHARPNSKKT